MLCAAMTYITADAKRSIDFIKFTDWDEVGVTSQDVYTWWEIHQKADEERRKAETRIQAAREYRQHVKRRAMEKLTAEEREALGLRWP